MNQLNPKLKWHQMHTIKNILNNSILKIQINKRIELPKLKVDKN